MHCGVLVQWGMSEPVRLHYEEHPYPHYPLLASVRACDTYALNLQALWGKFSGRLPPLPGQRILLAGCGSFSPYPFSVANPTSEITALDLSAVSLRRARMHCLLHGRTNVRYLAGDLMDRTVAAGPFGLIDAYGVLHHLEDPLAGLRALAERLVPGGILRVMVYNRYARREEESIRRALRMWGIHSIAEVKSLIRRSRPGSRLRNYCDASQEAGFDAGLADALLHPCVHTYRINDFVDMVHCAGLELLQFVHHGALEDAGDEVERIRGLEAQRHSCGNFVVYLGKDVAATRPKTENEYLVLNPCLAGAVKMFRTGVVHIPSRLGFENPRLDWRQRRFLSSFRRPVPSITLNPQTQAAVSVYKRSLFLIEYRETH